MCSASMGVYKMQVELTKEEIKSLKVACIIAMANKTIDSDTWIAIRKTVDKLHKQFPDISFKIGER